MASNELETPAGITLTINAALLPFTNSNDELPEMLVPLCRQNLEEIEAASSDINQKIDELKGHDESFLKDQKRVLHMKILCESLLSPVRRIPNELTGQVIRSCFDNPAILDNADCQLFAIVRSVCRQWRIVSLASHDLWRGGPTPNLALKVSYQTLPPDIREVLLDQEHRWTRLSLHLVLDPFLIHLRSTVNPWPELQHLELHHKRLASGFVVPCTFFLRLMDANRSNLPALKSVHLKEATLVLITAPAPFHATLSTLCLSECTVAFEMFQLIVDPRNFPCLENLALIQMYLTLPDPKPLPTVSNPRMRRVILKGLTAACFVPMLLFPNLEFVEMSHVYAQDSISLLEAFLTRCGSNIHTLVLRGKPYSFPLKQAVALACLPPKLRHLHIPDLEIFGHLVRSKPGYLSTLDIISCNGSKIKFTAATVDAILAHLEQRREKSMGNPAPLTMRFIDEAALLEHEGFQRLRRCGQVRIRLLSPGQMSSTPPVAVFQT